MDKEKVIKAIDICLGHGICNDCPYCLSGKGCTTMNCCDYMLRDALALLKKSEAIKPKTIPEELKLKMWNALYAEEDKFEEKYIGTKEQNSWFLIYRSWLQEGFNLAIKAIADWEGE